MNEIKLSKGATTLATRFLLARKVFKLTSAYDGAISRYLEDKLAC
jgi:phosphoribosylaminoimidazolecarboxamide formyltransferase/IMP cyclohydrolase